VKPWPAHPVVHEIFTWVWLADLEKRYGRAITLTDVPREVWDDIARSGIDAVWLMGIWQRSPAGAKIARTNKAMRADAQSTLSDLVDADIVGSAYCIRDYVVDRRFGGESALAVARRELAARGVRLVLDLVPNHTAPDHRWAFEHPEFYIQATAADLARDPNAFIRVGDRVLACGKDPYFPAWPEVLQLDASHAGLRTAMVELVASIGKRCDGVRCDMAMLMLDDVFVRTWGDRASGGPRPDGGRGYWPTVIGATKAKQPDFMFFAEAYWDLESVLVQQGFDACYDKRLYDRLVHREPAESIRAHLRADLAYQRHTVRFVENHDEPRAASITDPALHRAMLAMVLTLPGVALLHEGEADGRRIHVPVILGRRPTEVPDRELHAYVDRLLAVIAEGVRDGVWALASIEGWPDNRSAERLIGWTWTARDHRYLVVVNDSDSRADGRVRLPWTDLRAKKLVFDDRLAGVRYEHDGNELAANGVYVALEGRGVHLFRVSGA
jgi:hypothetical protein